MSAYIGAYHPPSRSNKRGWNWWSTQRKSNIGKGRQKPRKTWQIHTLPQCKNRISASHCLLGILAAISKAAHRFSSLPDLTFPCKPTFLNRAFGFFLGTRFSWKMGRAPFKHCLTNYWIRGRIIGFFDRIPDYSYGSCLVAFSCSYLIRNLNFNCSQHNFTFR